MHRLTREVRFAINATTDAQLSSKPTNSHAGFPSLTGLGYFFRIRVTLEGPLDGNSHYVRNIHEIDEVVRRRGIPYVDREVLNSRFLGGGVLLLDLFERLEDGWPGASLARLEFAISPFLSFAVEASEKPMVRLSLMFEFSASHRLHNPALDEESNRRTFGKCNNPHGHGHNYEVRVTLRGKPDANGLLIEIPSFERTVHEAAIDRFDHRNLNLDVPEFRDLIPSVENIAMVIFRSLKPKFQTEHASLAAVTVWETPKTFCEYSE